MEPYRCPKCAALVVDRRWPTCTTCRAQLPPEWVLTDDQIGKLATIDAHARAEHAATMDNLASPTAPDTTPDVPLVEPGSTGM